MDIWLVFENGPDLCEEFGVTSNYKRMAAKLSAANCKSKGAYVIGGYEWTRPDGTTLLVLNISDKETVTWLTEMTQSRSGLWSPGMI